MGDVMPVIEHISFGSPAHLRWLREMSAPSSAPRDLRCGCGYEWTEHVRPDDPAPPCPVCHSEAVADA